MIRGVQITARKCQCLKLETLLEVKTQLQKFVTVNEFFSVIRNIER